MNNLEMTSSDIPMNNGNPLATVTMRQDYVEEEYGAEPPVLPSILAGTTILVQATTQTEKINTTIISSKKGANDVYGTDVRMDPNSTQFTVFFVSMFITCSGFALLYYKVKSSLKAPIREIKASYEEIISGYQQY
jgi:hypothetical protein